MVSGSCLCGAVSFEVAGDLPVADGCHCTICRKFSGHYFVSADVPKSALTVTGEENVTWYASSKKVRRGFCRICGASLFFNPPANDWIAVALGAVDGPTGTRMSEHIFTANKGDYYEIADGLPQHNTIPRHEG